MNRDEGMRGPHAAAFSLLADANGKLHLFLDTLLLSASSVDGRVWTHETFITFKTVDVEKLIKRDYTPEELQGLGELLIGELRVIFRRMHDK